MTKTYTAFLSFGGILAVAFAGTHCGPGDSCEVYLTCPTSGAAQGGSGGAGGNAPNGGGGAGLGGGSSTGGGGQGGDGGSQGGAGGGEPTQPISLGLGDGHSCAAMPNGTTKCWGSNEYGQLGDGTLAQSSVPKTVAGMMGATAVAGGSYSTCALKGDGTVWCWGRNNDGQLGNGTTTASSIPVQVNGITTAANIAAYFSAACAVLADNTARCWGRNLSGVLGDGGASGNYAYSPVAVAQSNIAEISLGVGFACARIINGTVRCWGSGGSGQLGDGQMTTSYTPVTVLGINNAVSLSTAGSHACVVRAGGSVWCWGQNSQGQIGNGSAGGIVTSPIEVAGIASAVQVSLGAAHSCVVLNGGSAYCWGQASSGQLGHGMTLTNVPSPVQVAGLNAASIAGGASSTCATTVGNAVYCWGSNDVGQLGIGSMTNWNEPVLVQGL